MKRGGGDINDLRSYHWDGQAGTAFLSLSSCRERRQDFIVTGCHPVHRIDGEPYTKLTRLGIRSAVYDSSIGANVVSTLDATLVGLEPTTI